MDLRKVQETGGTYFVSLPRDWAQKSGVRKGSLVSVVTTENGQLVIDPKYELEKNFKLTEVVPSPYLKREIIGKYLLGYDIIKINGKKRLPPRTSEKVREIIQGLIGLEIIEEDASRILIQFVLEPALFTPDKILRRQYLFASSMHEDVMVALLERDASLAHAVLKRDDEVDRLYFLLVRLLRTIVLHPYLSEKMGLSLIDCLDYRMIASYVEALGDYICNMAREIIECSQIAIPDNLLLYIKRINNNAYIMHKNAIQAVFSKDYKSIDAVTKANLAARNQLDDVEKLLIEHSEITILASSICFSLSRICDISIDIADIVLPIDFLEE